MFGDRPRPSTSTHLMKPTFKDARAWEQAQLLMQPTFIRVVDNIRKQLDLSQWKGRYEEFDSPYPGYELHLTLGKESVVVDLWELCYRVCFQDYRPTHSDRAIAVEIDTQLLDKEGEVDWQALDAKTKRLIEDVFANLPQEK